MEQKKVNIVLDALMIRRMIFANTSKIQQQMYCNTVFEIQQD